MSPMLSDDQATRRAPFGLQPLAPRRHHAPIKEPFTDLSFDFCCQPLVADSVDVLHGPVAVLEPPSADIPRGCWPAAGSSHAGGETPLVIPAGAKRRAGTGSSHP